jgi:hypothetical protein
MVFGIAESLLYVKLNLYLSIFSWHRGGTVAAEKSDKGKKGKAIPVTDRGGPQPYAPAAFYSPGRFPVLISVTG